MATMEKLGKTWFGRTCEQCGVRDWASRFHPSMEYIYTGSWKHRTKSLVTEYRCANCGHTWETAQDVTHRASP